MTDRLKRELCDQLLNPLHQVVGFAYIISLEENLDTKEDYYDHLELASEELTTKLKALIDSVDEPAICILRKVCERS